MSLLALVQSTTWMILPDYLDLIVEIVSRERTLEDTAKGIKEAEKIRSDRESSPDMLAIKQGEKLSDKSSVRVREGVAIVSVIGPMVRYADFFSDISGGTSTERLARSFAEAENAASVHSTALFIDSPGGEAFGIAEMAGIIAAAKKPVIAYVGGYGASAAYYLASAADEIVIDSSAMLGSIGTVMEATDYSKAYEARGIKKHQYVSQQSPRKRPRMGTETGDSQLQELVDDMAQVFVEDVARYRGVSVETVLNDFGRGGLLVGHKAVAAGLADRIGSFEGLLAEMAEGKKSKTRRPAAASHKLGNSQPEPEASEPGANSGGEEMSDKKGFIKSLFSGWSSEDKKDALAALSEGEADKSTTVAPPSVTTQSASGDSEQVRQLQAQIETERNARIQSQAESFADFLCGPGQRKALPAERGAIIQDYVTAAMDDAQSPRKVAFQSIEMSADNKPVVKQMEGTRVDALKARYGARPSHVLTGELVAFDESAMRALSSGSGAQDVITQAEAAGRAYAEAQNKAQSRRVN